MTTLVSWITYSTTGEKSELPRAIYIASDSRITWGSDSLRWDSGRKVFSSSIEPHMFAYCGDVVFPSLVLAQLVTAIDNNVLFESGSTAEQKHETVYEVIKSSYGKGHNHPLTDFSIIHVYRTAIWPSTEFKFWHIKYTAKNRKWESNEVTLPLETGLIVSLGSGSSSAKNHEYNWAKSDVGGTSRSYFSAFCDSISSEDDKLSGGAPQLCAIYPNLAPQNLGVIIDKRYFLYGMELEFTEQLQNIDWKDELFRDVDAKTGQLKVGARRFVRPHGT